MEDTVRALDQLLHSGRHAELERAARDLLGRQRFYLWHLYLIVALLRTGRREEAVRELDVLFSYKFNIEDRAWPEIKEAFPEKFGQHFILSTMKPELGFESFGATRRHWRVPFPIGDEARFAQVVDEMLAEAVPALPALDAAATRVTTFGSCFAANLARHLNAAGVAATNLLIEESINSPLANRAFLAALAAPQATPDGEKIEATFGSGFLEKARAQLKEASVIVVTLGVAPSFFHAGSERFAFLEPYRPLLAEGKVYMRTPPVGQTKAVVRECFEHLRALNPAARVYASISPVPLMGTVEMENTIVADAVSKSTLRVCLHELLQERAIGQVLYWPSFEIVRWLGAHATLPVFGADDAVSRHVSEWVVKLIVERFKRHLFEAPAPAAAPRPRFY